MMSSSKAAPGSPSRPPFASLNNSPAARPSSLRDVIYKSGAPRKALLSDRAAQGVAAGVTVKKRSTSPHKVSENNGAGSRSPVKAKAGLAAGGGLGRMDVVSNDWEAKPDAGAKKSPVKKGKHLDRYVPARGAASNQDHTGPILIPHSSASSDSSNPSTGTLPDPDPTHTSDLSAALGLDSSKRILSFFAEPPPSQTEHSALLASYARLPSRSSSMASTSSTTTTRRRIASAPERVLDAPGLVDDYYLNLLDWSSTNLVAVGLGESVYVWNATSGTVDLLCSVGGTPATEDEYVCSVRFAEDGSYLAVGVSSGTVQMYDLSTGKCVRNMRGHLDRVASLCWSGAILSSGSKTGEIWNSDVRISQHKVAELSGHRAEVCGLEWRPEVAGGLSGGGQGLLASGGNDNVVNVWDGRMTSAAKMSKTNHTAAVKALAWAPWNPSLLASGGGSSDRTIHFWDTRSSSRLHSLKTGSQVTSLVFNPHAKEVLSSHGIPDHQLAIWAYPTLSKVTDIPQAHETRILHSCLSPDGTTVATASSDENLKFWKVFEGRKGKTTTKFGGVNDVEEDNGIQRKGKTGIHVR